jgi:(1->4)-alpha-D-glucan 1-alpha-D-glucosylmutase
VKSDRRWRDWTGNDLRLALSRIIACLSNYRTYRRVAEKPGATDIAVIDRAADAALRRNRSSDPTPLLFVRDLWTGRYPDARTAPELKTWAENWVGKLQQFTGAIMAKSVEDTLFYRYVRLLGANDVGHSPAVFGRPAAAFHEASLHRLQNEPASMLATSTHDTKMSEDVRARLLALSEIPERWGTALQQWSASNRSYKIQVDGLEAPDANEEYLLYQILLGAWPLDEESLDDNFRERIKNYMHKALAESKANTNWINPNEKWLKACDHFIDFILDRQRAGAFWKDFVPFAADLSWRGMNLSLAQVVLKLTVPGVPDFYQGTELWDFSLVDPDNRRPVDYSSRRDLLDTLDQTSVKELFHAWKDGRIKMRIIRSLLRYRREYPELFSYGSYSSVEIGGPNANHFVSFLRQHGPEQLLVIARVRLGKEGAEPRQPITDETLLTLPKTTSVWLDLLSQRRLSKPANQWPVDSLLNGLPVGIFRNAIE